MNALLSALGAGFARGLFAPGGRTPALRRRSRPPVHQREVNEAPAAPAPSRPPEEPLFDVAACVVCGCTDDRACEGGCYWVDVGDPVDVCSACVEAYARTKKPAAPPEPPAQELPPPIRRRGAALPARLPRLGEDRL